MFSFDRSLKNFLIATFVIVFFTIGIFTTATLSIDKQHRLKDAKTNLTNLVEEQYRLIVSNNEEQLIPPLSELNDQLNVLLEDGFAESLKTYIVDQEGIVVWATFDTGMDLPIPEAIIEIASGNNVNSLQYRDYRGVNVLSAFKLLEDRWILITEVNKREVLQSFYQIAIVFIATSIFLCFLIYWLLLKLYNKVHQPIKAVIDSTDQLASGNVNTQINEEIISDCDVEYQKLCNEFNKVINIMKATTDNLDRVEQNFKSLVSSTKDAVILADKNMNVLLWNPGAEDIFQYTQEEMEGRTFLTIIPDCYKEQHEKAFKSYLTKANKPDKTLELTAVRKDGSQFPVELTVTSWEFQEEVYIYGIVRDITNRKKTEEVISSTHDRYRTAFENSGVGIVLVTFEGDFIYFNPAFAKLLKYNVNELVEISLLQITYPEDLFTDKQLFEKLTAKKIDKYQVEKRFIRKDQSIIWVCLTISNLVLHDEEYIIAMVEDITEKKEAEEALRRSEQYLNRIVETIPSGVAIIDVSGRVIFANSMAANILKVDRRKLLHGSVNIFNLEITTISGEPIINNHLFEDYLLKKKNPIRNLEITLNGSKNKNTQISLNAAPLIEDGEVTGILVSIVDISQRIKNEKSLIELNKILEEKSMKDALTDIANRRKFNEVFVYEWSRHQRNNTDLSIILFDIDHFKKFNDTYGHQHGDYCLKIVANAAQKCLNRTTDLVARYGGEEFIVILPETDLNGAIYVAEKIRKEIELLQIPHTQLNNTSVVTISAGVASSQKDNQLLMPLKLIEQADKALYKAKFSGRNRVESM